TSANAVGGFDLTVNGPAGTTVSQISSYCTDLTQGIGGPPGTFFVHPSLFSTSYLLTFPPANYGRLGYLYNTYGRFVGSVPDPTNNGYGDSINSAGLQLAVWALEYNASPVVSLSNPNTPFEVNGTLTSSQVLNSANAYLSAASGKSQD